MITDSERLNARIACNIQNDEEYLAGWAERLKNDPVYALQWADSTYKAAARLAVSKWVLMLLKDVSMADVRKALSDQVLQSARNPAFSTSPSSNVMDACLLEARSMMYDSLERWS